LKSRAMDEIFQHAYSVGPWKDGAVIGWELPFSKELNEYINRADELRDRIAGLEAQLNQPPDPNVPPQPDQDSGA
jgi:hypothetical protein